ncbi:MAG: pyrroloquinoline quinone biosynthesis protein B [Candidatus Eremiobacteraeota bacterium]|nr:pyrroloquinoline quinone biosynthesis protein B [Candidatus Eremiobacteraeota bacterium]MBV9648042.1 pyrroloquinoline quinone biosynthesis protein B [Candidatus Eremiobacteraeota bacterium]
MIVRILGSAAGGGVPQWNCACSNCRAARMGVQPFRLQSSFALSDDGERWYLVNVSPDVAAQIEAFPPLQPRGLRGTPILGALITDANVDHLGGLMVLRQQGEHHFVLRSSQLVRSIATSQPAFAPFTEPPHRWQAVEPDVPCPSVWDGDSIGSALEVVAHSVRGLTPGYAGRREAPDAALAFEVIDHRTGGRALFAPIFAALHDRLYERIAGVDVAFLDGSFFSDDEMRALGLGEKSARHLGHQPVGGDGGTLAAIGTLDNRRIFVHLNNSNPMLDPDSAAARAVAEAGAEIAYDGMEFVL